jgi:polysaccharide deacetylase 2 family uncharacterized protein YibQ
MGQSLGLNPMRMVALVALAVAGVLGGYLLGKYVKPASPPIMQNADPLPPQSAQNPVSETSQKVDEHHHYEESLPRNIIIQENGQLKRIALPEPDMILDLGGKPELIGESSELPQAEDTATASSTPDATTIAEADQDLAEAASEAAQEVASLPPAILARAMPEDLATLQANSADSLPPWLRNAVPFALDDTKAKIVIVMDDLGLNKRRARKTVALPGPLTLSYMAYAEDLDRQIQQARAAGHEMMLHIPMEPRSATIDPGPNVLLSGLPREELLKSINWNLDQTDKVVGINNHMGSRFTSDLEGMQTVTEVLNERGLLFLDSVTSGSSVAHTAAEDAGIPFAVRNVFLDHEDDLASIKRQLRATESVAKRTGVAIAIGHPRDKTLEALGEWLPTLSERGFQLVPISAVVKIKTDRS